LGEVHSDDSNGKEHIHTFGHGKKKHGGLLADPSLTTHSLDKLFDGRQHFHHRKQVVLDYIDQCGLKTLLDAKRFSPVQHE